MPLFTHLKGHSGTKDRIGNLRDGTGNQETGGKNTDNWSEWKDSLDKAREELVGSHSDGNRSQDDL